MMNEDYLLSIIADIQKNKSHTVPNIALRDEIMVRLYSDMKQCLNGLLKTDKITYSRTLNSWGVAVK